MASRSTSATREPGGERFPVIDLASVVAGAPGAAERAAEELRIACEGVAFFFIKNHGVPQAMLDGIVAESARFHGLPMEEKMKVKVGGDMLGYLPPGGQTQRTSIYNRNTRRELSASFYIRREYPPDHPDRLAGRPWSYENRWPENLPGFRETLLAYFDAVDGVIGHLLPLFSMALGLGPRFLSDHPAFSPPNPTVRLLEYPSQDPDEENLFGIGPHSDYGCLTILNPGKTPGLEILMPSGEWVAAPIMPGHFLINTGALLTRWCNDRFPATPHRVINTAGTLRHSVATLVASRQDVVLECLPSCHGPGNPPKYPPISYGDYIAEIRRKNYDLPDQADREGAAAE